MSSLTTRGWAKTEVVLPLAGTAWNFYQHRRTPGTAGAGKLPDLFTIGLLKGHHRTAFDGRVDDHQVLVQHWRSRGTPTRRSRADTRRPELLPLQVKTEDAGLAEENVYVFAIAGWRTRCIAMLGIVTWLVHRLGQFRLDFLGPANRPGLAFEADEMPQQVLLFAEGRRGFTVATVAGEIDGIPDRDRAGSAHAGELGLKDDVLGLGPFVRNALRVATSAAAGTAELHPVDGGSGGGIAEEDCGEEEEYVSSHGKVLLCVRRDSSEMITEYAPKRKEKTMRTGR